MLWQGAIVDIPDRWLLCDGQNETPDLRDEMVLGSQGTYGQDITGGTSIHDHAFTGDGHVHEIPIGTAISAKSGSLRTTDPEQASGLSIESPNVPPYYALAYIMYVGD